MEKMRAVSTRQGGAGALVHVIDLVVGDRVMWGGRWVTLVAIKQMTHSTRTLIGEGNVQMPGVGIAQKIRRMPVAAVNAA